MIYIVDKRVYDKEHVIFNTAFIRMLCDIYMHEEIRVYADQTHINNLLPAFTSDIRNNYSRLKFEPCEVLHYKPNSNAFSKLMQFARQRIFKDSFFFIALLKKMSPKANDILFLTHAQPLSFFLFSIIKQFFSGRKIYMVLHGDADSALIKNKFGIPTTFWGITYLLSFKLKKKNAHYILLSKLGGKILSEKKILHKEEIVSIYHPYQYTSRNINLLNIDKKINIGYIGTLASRKNGELFIKLADTMQNNNNFIFSQAGYIEPSMQPLVGNNIEVINRNNFAIIDRKLFEAKVEEMDYAIFVFTNSDFVIRVSGAFYDAVEFSKPLIALESNYFSDIFKEAGNIGYLCKDFNGILELLNYIENNKEIVKEEYKIQVNNLVKYKENLSFENIEKDLKAQLLQV